MDSVFEYDGVAGCAALEGKMAGCSALLPLPEATEAGRSDLFELLEASANMGRCMTTRGLQK